MVAEFILLVWRNFDVVSIDLKIIRYSSRMATYDSVDDQLLAELQKDARQTNRELARAVGIAESTCLERVRNLQRSGAIEGFHAEIDLASLGRNVQAIISVRLQPKTRKAIEAFTEFVVTLPETLAMFVVSGSDDFLVQVAVADPAQLEAFVLDHIAQHPNIADVHTALVYEHIKRRPLERLDVSSSGSRLAPR